MSTSHSNRRSRDSADLVPSGAVRPSNRDLASLLPEVSDRRSARGNIALIAAVPRRRHSRATRDPHSIPVPRIARDFQVKIATTRNEWKQAFELVAQNYQACGYEAPLSSKVRFTPYHALPDTVTFVAKLDGRVAMTFTQVPDNTQMGLPLESIYKEEIKQLRRERRRMAEIISLAADKEVNMREFRQIFVTVIKLAFQYHISRGGDTWVITINPRHRDFYRKAMGFVELGPPRAYSAVQDHPAEAYYLDVEIMKAKAPKMHHELFGEAVPGEALVAPKMLPHLVRFLGNQTSPASAQIIRESFNFDKYLTNPRRW